MIYVNNEEQSGNIYVDQSYNPASENAISGKALNGALTYYVKKEWTLLTTQAGGSFTIPDNANEISIITLNSARTEIAGNTTLNVAFLQGITSLSIPSSYGSRAYFTISNKTVTFSSGDYSTFKVFYR